MNKDEMKMIKEMASIICKETSNKGLCEKCDFKKHEQFGYTYQCRKFDDAEALYDAGCRIIADDEIVIKKSEYEELKTHIEDLQTKLGAVMLCIKNTHEIDISDLLEKQKRATAREIFYKLKETLIINNEENTEWFDYDFTLETINELAKKHGIELED